MQTQKNPSEKDKRDTLRVETRELCETSLLLAPALKREIEVLLPLLAPEQIQEIYHILRSEPNMIAGIVRGMNEGDASAFVDTVHRAASSLNRSYNECADRLERNQAEHTLSDFVDSPQQDVA